jgi:hypothetical protein
MCRLADRPSKVHVCDALDALLAFVKVQKRELRRRNKNAEITVKPSGRGYPPSIPRGSEPVEKPVEKSADWSPLQIPMFGGMEDVD